MQLWRGAEWSPAFPTLSIFYLYRLCQDIIIITPFHFLPSSLDQSESCQLCWGWGGRKHMLMYAFPIVYFQCGLVRTVTLFFFGSLQVFLYLVLLVSCMVLWPRRKKLTHTHTILSFPIWRGTVSYAYRGAIWEKWHDCWTGLSRIECLNIPSYVTKWLRGSEMNSIVGQWNA